MLELRRQPRPKWHVIYIDVEGARDAADLFADILAQLASHPTYRRRIENIPGWQAAKDILSAADVSAKAGDLKVEFASAMRADWQRRPDQIRARLAATEAEGRLLIVIDELEAASREKPGWATQEALALLQRIIKAQQQRKRSGARFRYRLRHLLRGCCH